jgi:hypothetical protein
MIAVLSQVSNCLLMEVGHKSSDVIEINQNTPEQSLSPGKVLVAIKAARVNPVDLKIASVHQKLPLASVAISVLLLLLFMYSLW